MGSLRTLRAACLALLLGGAQSAFADDPDLLAQAFADRAGRYSALTRHLWLFDGPASENAAARAAAFADLVEAVAPLSGVSAKRLMGWRVEARASQAALLSAATFRHDARAAALAQARILRCNRLLPGA